VTNNERFFVSINFILENNMNSSDIEKKIVVVTVGRASISNL
jgi:hypothetical protein